MRSGKYAGACETGRARDLSAPGLYFVDNVDLGCIGVAGAAKLTIADEVWIAVALLHHESRQRDDFAVREILDRVRAEGVSQGWRPGIEAHVRQHCVANRPPSPARLRMLFATSTRTRRLFRPGDPYHPGRSRGRTLPARGTIPERYASLLNWYLSTYAPAAQSERGDPILALRGLGKEIWQDEAPDQYVARLRRGWE